MNKHIKIESNNVAILVKKFKITKFILIKSK